MPTTEGDLLVSSMAQRAKPQAVSRDGKVSLCVLDGDWPVSCLQVYAETTVEFDRDLVVDVMSEVATPMSANQ